MESNLKPSRKWDKTFKKVGHFLQGNIPQRPRYRFTVVYIVKTRKFPPPSTASATLIVTAIYGWEVE
jgi:hypothetical protein